MSNDLKKIEALLGCDPGEAPKRVKLLLDHVAELEKDGRATEKVLRRVVGPDYAWKTGTWVELAKAAIRALRREHKEDTKSLKAFILYQEECNAMLSAELEEYRD